MSEAKLTLAKEGLGEAVFVNEMGGRVMTVIQASVRRADGQRGRLYVKTPSSQNAANGTEVIGFETVVKSDKVAISDKVFCHRYDNNRSAIRCYKPAPFCF